MPLFNREKQASSASVAGRLKHIVGVFEQFIVQFNEQSDDPSLAFTMEEHESESFGPRTLVCNTYFALSIRAEKSWIKAHLFRTSELLAAEKQETPLNLKLALQVVSIGGVDHLRLETESVIDEELPVMLLSVFEELVRKSQAVASRGSAPRVVLNGHSIATAVRNLVNDRNQALAELITQNEQIHNSIARDIHDQVISDLMMLQKLQAERSAPEQEIEMVQDAIQSLRDVCSGLSSRDLKDWGLVPCLVEFAKKTQRKSEVPISVIADPELPALEFDVSVHAFRIVQEAVNNAIKHADANQITVSLRRNDDKLNVTVGDDGKGLGMRKSSRGMGTNIMSERVALIDLLMPCELFVRARQPSGVEVLLQLQLPTQTSPP